MQKRALFIYPNTSETYKHGGNSYIRNLVLHLSKDYTIVNKRTAIGLLDMLLKIHKCDVLYFNWIEDLPERRFGFIQIPLLYCLLFIAKLRAIKIVWFIHNNISHNNKHLFFKKGIVGLMKRHADLILSHSNEVTLDVPRQKFHVFHHPIETATPVDSKGPYQYDLLIWGTVSPYKGISEFIDFAATTPALKNYTILIAGKFHSSQYYEDVKKKKPENITVINKTLSEDELREFFSVCRYVLFTYNSPSVLSSAALCKTLSLRKEVIAPNAGSFKELGSMGLLYNYNSFSSLETLLNGLKNGKIRPVNDAALNKYIQTTTWKDFTRFLIKTINTLYEKPVRELDKV